MVESRLRACGWPLFGLALLLLGAAAARASELVLRPEAIRAHLEFLASDLLEGRLTGTRGFDLAAAYVAAGLAASGFAPAGDGDSYFQGVRLREVAPLDGGARVYLRRAGERIALAESIDFLGAPSYVETETELRAGLVFVGFAVTAPELDHDDLAGLDLAGRVAVVLTGAPARFAADARAIYSWRQGKLDRLASHGVVGVIWVDSPADAARRPWSRAVEHRLTPRMRWLDANGSPVDANPGIRATLSVSSAGAERLFAGAPRPLTEVFRRAEAGEAQGFALPGEIEVELRSTAREIASANVVGRLAGADPDLAEESVVLSAHLDHVGLGSAVAGDAIYNGAHDNASGCAILLEVARALAGGPRPRRSIVLLFVTGEERGLLGSDRFAQGPPAAAGRSVANVNLDMPLVFAPTRDLLAFGGEHTSLGPALERMLFAEGLTRGHDPAPEEVVFVRSDQLSFLRRGVPSIYLSGGRVARDPDFDLPRLQAEFLAEHYHRPSDDLSRPFSAEAAVTLGRVTGRLTLAIADAAEAPSWNPGDFFGEMFRAQAKEASAGGR